MLLEAAGRLNATDLARAARHLLDVVDPDRTDRDAEKALDRADRAAHLGRYLSITEDGAGGVRLRGRGTLEDAATLKAALLPLTAPVPATDPVTGEENKDPRDHGARLWDALITTAEHALTTDLPPDSHGTRPRVSITISLDALLARFHDQLAGTGLAVPARAHPTTPRHPPQTRTGTGSTGPPWAPGPASPRTASNSPPPPCGAWPATPTSSRSRSAPPVEVLDVGRLHRLVTPALWRALVCRDRHCAFPGCTRPPLMCHAHHIVHWLHGGTTKLHNLVLLCGHHHRLIHHTPWQVRIGTDGHPEFLPPPKPGQPPEWIRHRPRRE